MQRARIGSYGLVGATVIIAVVVIAGLAILAFTTRRARPNNPGNTPTASGQGLNLNKFAVPKNSFASAVINVKFKNAVTFSSGTHNLDAVSGGLAPDTLQALKKAGATSFKDIFDTTYKVSLPKEASISAVAASLSGTSSVAYAEPNYFLHLLKTPNDPQYSGQWDWPKIQAPSAWDTTTGSNSITVAVLDTGDSNHPDLVGNTIPGKNMFDESKPPTDVLGGVCEWARGHGTHVAGTIGAIGNNSNGVTGLNWQSKILQINIADPNHPLCDEPDDVAAKAIRYAADNGARVVNMSFGDMFSSPNATNPQVIKEAVQYAVGKNVVLVAAAGNDHGKDVKDFYPASFDGVIAVSATTPQDTIADFSNIGDRIDVAAPGVDVLSTYPGGYKHMSGTSMASPHVAGLAALILSANPNLSAADVKQIITSTADDLGPPGKDKYFGYGRINAKKALEEAKKRAGNNPGNPGNPGNPNPPADKGQVHGSVKTTTGALIQTANIKMKLARPDGSTTEVTSGSDGTYTFNPEPYGQYVLSVSSYPQNAYSNPTPSSTSVTLSATNRTPAIDITFTASNGGGGGGGGGGGANCSRPSIMGDPTDNNTTFSITGIAYYQGNGAFDYNDRYKGCALVTLKQDGVVKYTVATAQDDGTYGFTGLARGNYTVELTPNPDINVVSGNPLQFTDLASSATLANFRLTRK